VRKAGKGGAPADRRQRRRFRRSPSTPNRRRNNKKILFSLFFRLSSFTLIIGSKSQSKRN